MRAPVKMAALAEVRLETTTSRPISRAPLVPSARCTTSVATALEPATPADAEGGQERPVDQQVEAGDEDEARHERADHRAPGIPDLTRQIGRLVPAAVRQQDEHHDETEGGGRRRPCAVRGGVGRGRQQAGDDDEQDAADLDAGEHVLGGRAVADPGEVRRGEHDHGERGIQR